MGGAYENLYFDVKVLRVAVCKDGESAVSDPLANP